MVPESNQVSSEISEGALNLNIYFDVYFITAIIMRVNPTFICVIPEYSCTINLLLKPCLHFVCYNEMIDKCAEHCTALYKNSGIEH